METVTTVVAITLPNQGRSAQRTALHATLVQNQTIGNRFARQSQYLVIGTDDQGQGHGKITKEMPKPGQDRQAANVHSIVKLQENLRVQGDVRKI